MVEYKQDGLKTRWNSTGLKTEKAEQSWWNMDTVKNTKR